MWRIYRILLRVGRQVERLIERIGRMRGAPPLLDPYIGYATPEGWVVRARVLTALRRTAPRPEASRWTNLRQMAALFLTDEVANVRVRAGPVVSASNAEGYVTAMVPAGEAHGWAEVPLHIEGQAPAICPVRVPGADAAFAVISDIDDTVIETGAHSIWRNLWTTFTGSALTRKVHPDAVALLTQATAGGRNPVFYVSSSPWNLHHFLDTLFRRNGVPRGPMFLRDLGLTTDGIGRSHLGHKGAAIDRILAANPHLPVLLMGDTGQHDAEIYRAAVERHPGRILGVALREPRPGVAGPHGADAIEGIEAAGVPCHHGPSFEGAAERLGIIR